jgi:hypothetical protein
MGGVDSAATSTSALRAALGKLPGSALAEALGAPLCDTLWTTLRDALGPTPGKALGAALGTALGDPIGPALDKALGAELGAAPLFALEHRWGGGGVQRKNTHWVHYSVTGVMEEALLLNLHPAMHYVLARRTTSRFGSLGSSMEP